MTFDELCDQMKATIDERREIVHVLAAYRMRKTLEALLPIKVIVNG